MHISRSVAALATSALVLVACGTGTTSAGPEPTSAPSTTAAATSPAADATADGDAPERIVSLSPTATESLFAIGAGDQVVAADSFSTYPPEAPSDPDLSAFSPNVEAIAEYEPDLVVLSNNPDDIQAQLEAVGIETALLPAVTTVDEAYDQIEEVGELTGQADAAADLVSQMQDEIAGLVDSVDAPEGTTYYHELDDTSYSVTSTTFVGDVYGLFGMTSIADEASDPEQDGGYPQLSAEYIIEADPDLVFLADTDCCDVSAESVAERAGWDQLSAVQGGNVVELGDDIPSRWGPRIVDFAQMVADAIEGLDQS